MNSTLNGVDIMLQHSKHQDENVKKNKRKTRISVAALYDPETRELSFGVSRCSKQDNFCKKVGRELAVGRLDLLGKNPTMTINVEPETDLQRLFRNKFNQLESFLQKNGIKKIGLPLADGGLDNLPGAERAFEVKKATQFSESEIK